MGYRANSFSHLARLEKQRGEAEKLHADIAILENQLQIEKARAESLSSEIDNLNQKLNQERSDNEALKADSCQNETTLQEIKNEAKSVIDGLQEEARVLKHEKDIALADVEQHSKTSKDYFKEGQELLKQKTALETKHML